MNRIRPGLGAFSIATVHALTRSPSHTYGKEPPILRFGVIADIQYANIDDGFNFARTVRRHFRGSLAMLDAAVGYWTERRVDLVCQMGDIIDGKAKLESDSEKDLHAVLAKLNRVQPQGGYLHLIGNHELYNFDRAQLASKLQTRRTGGHPPGSEGKEFYRIQPCKGWRFLVLDSYQDAVIGESRSENDQARGQAILAKNNPNFLPDGPGTKDGATWFDGVVGESRRFVPYNGGFGDEQVAWLDRELQDAGRSGDRVVLLSHAILHPGACDGSTMAWDFEAALAAVERANSAWPGTVALVLAGHDHNGGFSSPQPLPPGGEVAAPSCPSSSSSSGAPAPVATSTGLAQKAEGALGRESELERGSQNVQASTNAAAAAQSPPPVYHVTLKSPLNLGEKGECFGCVDVYPDRLLLRGPNLSHLVHAKLLDAAAPSASSSSASTFPSHPPRAPPRFFVEEETGDHCVELRLADKSR